MTKSRQIPERRRMSATDELLANNGQYARRYSAEPPGRPARSVAVVACMDARMDEDVLRSLTISQHELGTTEVILIHHTRCGMQTFSNREFKHELEAETGHKPRWATLAFADVDADVRKSLGRVRACEFLRHTDQVRGFVFDVSDGTLREVT